MKSFFTDTQQTPFGNSIVANVLWKELSYLEHKHIEYVLSVYNDFTSTVKQLYKHKILGRELICDLLYKDCITRVDKYLSGDAYTYFCNIMQVAVKKQKAKKGS